MVTVIKTGDRESDLVQFAALLSPTEKKHAIQYDCQDQKQLQSALGSLEAISFIPGATIYVLHNLELTKELLEKIVTASETVILVTPTTKLKLQDNKQIKLISSPVTDQSIKTKIASLLASLHVVLPQTDLLKLYQSITITDDMGKERLSPLLYNTLERRIRALAEDDPVATLKAVQEILSIGITSVNQWDILANLFSANKQKQQAYFSALSEALSPYEIISFCKTTVLTALAILAGKQEHIDNTTIATKLGRHPFYVSSIAKTIMEKELTPAKVLRVCTRLMNLELALKSGKFDDERFGFEVLLATM